jgi:hypothetical protein
LSAVIRMRLRLRSISTDTSTPVAIVHSILPALADQAGIDWSQSVAAWSKDTMVNFLMLAWELITKAEAVHDHGSGKVLRKSEEWDKEGDPIPFEFRSSS